MNRIFTDKKWVRRVIPALTAAIVLIVFLPALKNGFLSWDDKANFLENLKYRGLGPSQLGWMFTTFHTGPYQPLSWVTFGLDYLVWGMNPFGYHLTNVALHCLNALAFYFLCLRLFTPADGTLPEEKSTEISLAAAFAVLFFALHPLRVESVAWITERRDVLSGLFYLLTILWYMRTRSLGGEQYSFRRRDLLPLAGFLLALMSKGMAITLPVVLIVLDIYPLRRLSVSPGKWSQPETRGVWLEKIPFFILALIFAAVGYAGQVQSGALRGYGDFGFSARCVQVLFSTALYMLKTLIPLNLLPIYQIPVGVGLLSPQIFLSGAVIAAVTAAVIVGRRRWPAALAVWAYYLVTLSPVSGVVKFGAQAAADRYTYLPCLGFAVLAGAGFLACRRTSDRWLRNICLICACSLLSILSLLTWRQEKIWRDAETLWRYALSVDPLLDHPHVNLGVELVEQGKIDEGVLHYKEALRINPRNSQAHIYMAQALSSQGRPDKAAGHMLEAYNLKSDDAEVHVNQSGILAAQGRLDEALEHGLKALRLDPGNARVHNNLGVILAAQGRPSEAVKYYQEALRCDPGFAPAHNNLATALNEVGRLEEAIPHYLEAVRLKPDYAEAYCNLGANLAARGRFAEAIPYYESALEISPGLVEAHNNLGTALSAQGRLGEAVAQYREALRLKPDFAIAHYSLGAVLYKQGKMAEAGSQYEAAIKLKPDYAEAYYNLSFVMHNRGKNEEAQTFYRKAIKLNPALAAPQNSR